MLLLLLHLPRRILVHSIRRFAHVGCECIIEREEKKMERFHLVWFGLGSVWFLLPLSPSARKMEKEKGKGMYNIYVYVYVQCRMQMEDPRRYKVGYFHIDDYMFVKSLDVFVWCVPTYYLLTVRERERERRGKEKRWQDGRWKEKRENTST